MGAIESLHDVANASPADPQEPNISLSQELQRLVDTIQSEPLYKMTFSLTVADPKLEDCPLIACSIGFSELTGYTVQEIVGRSCRFLLNGVPPELIDQETRMKARSFCAALQGGHQYDGQREGVPDGMEKPWVGLAEGEMICVQTNARKTGELFRNMFYLREIDLEDNVLIVGLQAGLSEDLEEDIPISELQDICKKAFVSLDANMSTVEHALASRFWFSAPMRRQN
jgi:hypothetical protein